MNWEQHETGVREGRSCVITAGQPSQIVIKTTNKPFAQEDSMRTGWDPACLTQARTAQVRFMATLNFRHLISPVGLQFPIWKTGTTTLPYWCCSETCPGRHMAGREGSASPGWTMFSQQPPRIKHQSWASPITSIPNTQLRHQVSNPSGKSSAITLLICKSIFLKEIQSDPENRLRRDLPPLTPRPSGHFKSFKHWKIQAAARPGKETY